ncbi:hypothetical protein EG349_00960 [Chryseobacterium shandongense]|uniref:Uncharacterized protein n=1 Tax=Chryseobacterium shandongense TaxID=1493872 RepID=A0AAD1DKJ3_9FLAO|nr:hypothetical protein EG349_00960 [Chryseobacterium shandongense]AZA97565.1 hypothetical protein EG353_19430 [Chryseobacterium shandongense]
MAYPFYYFKNLDFGECFPAPGRASCFEAQKTVMRHSKHNLPCSGEHKILPSVRIGCAGYNLCKNIYSN